MRTFLIPLGGVLVAGVVRTVAPRVPRWLALGSVAMVWAGSRPAFT